MAAGLLLSGCSSLPFPPPDSSDLTIAVGSCLQQGKPQPIWKAIRLQEPDVFVFMGDNIYGDTENMSVMRQKYAELSAVRNYRQLRKRSRILAVWDDHDYGVNDGGAEYPKKEASKREFLRFFQIPESSPRWRRPGNYDAVIIGEPGRRVQFILMDTRSFRSPLEARPREEWFEKGVYWPNTDRKATILGVDQWTWLKKVLREPAELRVLVSSIQAIPEEHPWEKWSNFPHEHARLMQVLQNVETGMVVIASGDRHIAEISGIDISEKGEPTRWIYELTSSSMNQRVVGNSNEKNRHRVAGGNYLENNFGTVKVWWADEKPRVVLQVRDVRGRVVREQTVKN